MSDSGDSARDTGGGKSARDSFVFFWGKKSPFSNWHPCTFTHAGRVMCCSEQAMMYEKAILFGDHDAAGKIMSATDPAEHKRLGRTVRGYSEAVWVSEREKIMDRVLLSKFSSNPGLAAALFSTAGRRMVEASPHDRIWGIGLPASAPEACDPARWRGLNLLGESLERTRDALSSLLSPSPSSPPSTSAPRSSVRFGFRPRSA